MNKSWLPTMFSSESATIEDYLRAQQCVVFPTVANTWVDGNSSVVSSPIIELHRIFDLSNEIEAAVNFVSIRGRSDEPLHFHIAHLVGVVLKGEGFLLTSSESEPSGIKRLSVSVGDVVIIPAGAFHFFEPGTADGELHYIALEFSNIGIDYQKHHLPN